MDFIRKIPSKTPLNTFRYVPNMALNRIFALVYSTAILALLYHHANKILYSNTFLSLSISTSMFIADLSLAFMWATTTSCRMSPLLRQALPENLGRVVKSSDFPAIDVFICTADPYKEPPMGVVNTALSLMAYDYPPEKISVYVSDDGGSQLTLFAFMEAAKFGKHWLPFCRENNVMDRSPDVFFQSNYVQSPESEKIKIMYESMRMRVEIVVESGEVSNHYITNQLDREAFSKWTKGFSRQEHPPVIQVLLNSNDKEDTDITGHKMPNLIYVSRGKGRAAHHHFKAGALNALLRVSATMTNAPIILTQDCDMYSNDPQTPHHMLCYFFDPSFRPNLGYVQFPQRYHGLNKADIYGGENQRLYIANPVGMNGLSGPAYVGSGCFFLRRAFFGGPSLITSPEIHELSPNHEVEKSIKDESVLSLAHHVSGCNYENQTKWGSKLGFRYGSLVEDYFTGYQLKCEGWKSIFYDPKRPAFLGDVPINLNDVLSQNKRWIMGLLEVTFSKYNPLAYGTRYLGFHMGVCYSHFAFWALWSIPIIIYSFLPQIALLNGLSIFPKIGDPWFFLYMFLTLGAYGHDCFDYIYFQGNFIKWWNDQRMWLIRGLSSYLFGLIEHAIKNLGIMSQGFNVTSKVQDVEQIKRYDQGTFEFGVSSPMFVPFTTAAVLNLVALIASFINIVAGRNMEDMFVQVLIASFGVLNSMPIYDAVMLRKDKGRMPSKVTFISTAMGLAICGASYFIF